MRLAGIGDGQRFGELGDTALARRIGRHQAAAEERQHGGGVDDGALPALGQAAAARAAQTRIDAVEVDVDHLGEDLGLQLLAAADDAGAVDDMVEARQAGDEQRP